MAEAATPTIEDQRRFWDWHWEHSEERKVVNEWTLHRGRTILNILRSLPLDHPKILDFGCGKGWFTEQLALLGEATGIDLSEEAIAFARSRAPHINFIVGNVYEFPLPEQHYDVVVSQEVIAHVENQAEYVNRCARVLKPGGYVVVASANKFVMHRLGDTWPGPLPGHISEYPSMGDLKRLLRPEFRILRATTILPMGNGGILRLINSYKLNTGIQRVIPARHLVAFKEWAGLGYQLIVLAQKRPSVKA